LSTGNSLALAVDLFELARVGVDLDDGETADPAPLAARRACASGGAVPYNQGGGATLSLRTDKRASARARDSLSPRTKRRHLADWSCPVLEDT
jgi:hypothetical protein